MIMPVVAEVGFWETEFKKQFYELQRQRQSHWDLKFGAPPSKSRCGWKKFREIGQVRFRCKQCRRSWATSKGIVIFHYRLEYHGRDGKVRMESMGQKCKRCNLAYESPKWEEEDVSYAVSELLAKVKENLYGIKSQNKRCRSRNVKPKKKKGPHLSNLCQACEKGVCEENKKDTAVAIDIDYSGVDSDRDYDVTETGKTDGFPVQSDNQLNCCVIVVGFICALLIAAVCFHLWGFNPAVALYTWFFP